MKRIAAAKEFAAHAHTGQYRECSGLPYVTHSLETADIVSAMGGDTDAIIAAILHDVVEDTEYTIYDIEERFGRHVASIVEDMSEDKMRHRNKTETWRERKEEHIDRIMKKCPIESKMVFLADKLSNMRASHEAWKISGNDIWKNFNQSDVSEQKWYCSTIADMLEKDFGNTDAWREYKSYVDAVFSGI